MRRALFGLVVLAATLAATPAAAGNKWQAPVGQFRTAAPLTVTAAMAAGTAACPPAGVYGFAASQATNGANQTYRWEFGVKWNGNCGLNPQVAYWSHHECSGNVGYPWCNFAARRAALFDKACLPDQACGYSMPWGSKDFTGLNGVVAGTFTGAWHTLSTVHSVKAVSSDHYVHFLSPDNYSLRPREGCSWWFAGGGGQAPGNGCPNVP
jgi:hypothetical protein